MKLAFSETYTCAQKGVMSFKSGTHTNNSRSITGENFTVEHREFTVNSRIMVADTHGQITGNQRKIQGKYMANKRLAAEVQSHGESRTNTGELGTISDLPGRGYHE